MRTLTLILCLLALRGHAADLMTADQFDAYTRGKTFIYGNAGGPYGAEEYLDDRRVRWSFLDGRCQEGAWYQKGDLICFTYDVEPEPQCWSFRRGANGLVARFAGDPQAQDLYEVERSARPLLCVGPDVGV